MPSATGSTGWSVGDEVCALLSGGGYAEQVAVPAGQVLPGAGGSRLVDAAALPEVVCTVWSNVFMTADLQPGETLLVHGGSSGIGTMAIQLAPRGRSPGRGDRGFGGEARALPRARGRDPGELPRAGLRRGRARGHRRARRRRVLDNMGAKYLARNLDALALNGRLVVIGLQGGARGRARPRAR